MSWLWYTKILSNLMLIFLSSSKLQVCYFTVYMLLINYGF